MIAMELPMPLSFLDRIEQRISRDFAEAEEQWGEVTVYMTKWEDENLLDNPTPEKLKDHKEALAKLISHGKLLSLAAGHPVFPERLAGNVSATLEVLKDKMQMWHGEQMSAEEADKVLQRCGLI